MMLKIALVTNYNISEKVYAAMQVADRLQREDCEILIAAFYKEKLMRTRKHRESFRYFQ